MSGLQTFLNGLPALALGAVIAFVVFVWATVIFPAMGRGKSVASVKPIRSTDLPWPFYKLIQWFSGAAGKD